jgi:hypothetical protein
MNSTMWKIALRTLARDEASALINIVALQSLNAARAHSARALRYE